MRDAQTRGELETAYQAAAAVVDRAYWKASGSDRDALRALKRAISNVLTGLRREDLEENDAAFDALAKSADGVNDRLSELGKGIAALAGDAKIAADWASAVDSLLPLASSYFSRT